MHSVAIFIEKGGRETRQETKQLLTFLVRYPSHKDFIRFPNKWLMKNKTLCYFTYFLNIRINLAFQALHPIYIN